MQGVRKRDQTEYETDEKFKYVCGLSDIMRGKKFCKGCRTELLIEKQRRVGLCIECELE